MSSYRVMLGNGLVGCTREIAVLTTDDYTDSEDQLDDMYDDAWELVQERVEYYLEEIK